MDVVRAARGARRPGGAVPPAHAARRERRMNAILTVARRELKALFDHPTAYILLVVFTSVNGFLFFREVDMYGVASLRPMLDLLPWLLLFLAPAVTMRALAEDSRSGTLEGVLSHFTGIDRGVIDLRDAVYFVTLAALFLLLAYFALMRRKLTARGASLQRLRLGTVLLAAAMIVVNLFGRHIGGRIDLTPGRSYTLAPPRSGCSAPCPTS